MTDPQTTRPTGSSTEYELGFVAGWRAAWTAAWLAFKRAYGND